MRDASALYAPEVAEVLGVEGTGPAWRPRGFGGSLGITAPVGATVSVRVASPVDVRGFGAACEVSRLSLLRKKFVSFVFDRTGKHGRFIGGGRVRRAVERTTL